MIEPILQYPAEVVVFGAVLGVILNGILRYTLPGYATEKGKNLATRQDIQVITDKIEEIKIQYSRDLEQSKASLQQLVHRNNFFLQKSTELLIMFYENLLILDHEKLDRNFGDLTGKNGALEAIFEHQQETERLFMSLRVDYNRLLVFMDGHIEIMDKCMEILHLVFAIEKVFKKHISSIKIALHKETKAAQLVEEEYALAIRNTNAVMGKYFNELPP